MINYETILSSFDDKMTLMQWLQKVEEALRGAGLESVTVTQSTPTTCVFKFNFADGTSVTSESISLPKGDKGDKGDKGNTGDTGNGISSISKTGTSGLVDTYTITYTNGNTQTFTVTNGAKGDTGKSVSSLSVDNQGVVSIVFSDGTTEANAGNVYYLISLSGASGTLTDAQYNLVSNYIYPNVYLYHNNIGYYQIQRTPTVITYARFHLDGTYAKVSISDSKAWNYTETNYVVLDVEGDSADITKGGVLSTGASAGTVLTADGDGLASWSKVKAGSVDSESATSGQVLQADGSGGASWQNASGGTTLTQYTYSIANNTTGRQKIGTIIYNAKGNVQGYILMTVDGMQITFPVSCVETVYSSIYRIKGVSMAVADLQNNKTYLVQAQCSSGNLSFSHWLSIATDGTIATGTSMSITGGEIRYWNDTQLH